ncbi:transmembrane amino acid transporter protein-domain-containing protein [Obelidium mucronatum]|nr:transmembrane amino acid transporter protein-domain-containing protein [Obelidium mucronatum]
MLLGVPIVYLILSGMNLELIFGIFSMKGWIVISALLVLIPFVTFKTLKEIAVFSAFGVFATLVVIATVIFYSIHDFPLKLGEMEASMAEPKKFHLVLSLSMVIISVMYLVTAILGYAAYGNLTDSPILNNLPKGFISNFSIFVITLHVLLAIPVVVTTFSLEMERRFDLLKVANGDTKREDMYRIVLRIGIMAFIVGLAIAIPFFKDFMTLLGAVANTALIFVFPVIFDFKLFGFNERPLSEKLFGILILIMGVFGGVVGGYEAIVALVNDINGVPNPGGGGGHYFF